MKRLSPLCAIALLGCSDSTGSSSSTQTFTVPSWAVGVSMRCLDGNYCPDGCSCSTSAGLGDCQRDGSGDACRYGQVGVTPDEPAFTNLAGQWREGYICVNNDGCEVSEDYPFTLTQSGGAISATFSNDGTSISGNLYSKNVAWSFYGTEWDETGVWTFTDPDTCTKVSLWRSKTGSESGYCVGFAVRVESGQTPCIPLPPECQ